MHSFSLAPKYFYTDLLTGWEIPSAGTYYRGTTLKSLFFSSSRNAFEILPTNNAAEKGKFTVHLFLRKSILAIFFKFGK